METSLLRHASNADIKSVKTRTRKVFKALAKRSQHVNATYCNIGHNMFRAFAHPVATCCNMLGVVGSKLAIFKLEPTTPNLSQNGGQTRATAQQCCDMLR